MKRPSFQFYPGDWQSDLKLRRCSPAARGVWLDLLCAFHDSDDGYGLLRWPLKDIANTIGASLSHVRELVDKGVLRGSDKELSEALVYIPRSGRKEGPAVTLVAPQAGPIWYSKRMVIDEHVRTIRGESSRFGWPDGESLKPAPKPPLGDGTSTPSPSPPSVDEVGGEDRGRALAEQIEAEGHAPTPAGAACRAIKAAGIMDVNPGHIDLLRLLKAGVTAEVLAATAAELVGKGKPRFLLLLSTVEGRLRDAAAKAAIPEVQRVPWHETRAGIEAKGVELGLGAWDERAFSLGQGIPWPTYQARVFKAAGHDGRIAA